MQDTWTDIPDYQSKYQADRESNIRRVFSSGHTRLMQPYHKKMRGSQRLVVKLTLDSKAREEIVAQLIAKTFLGVCPAGCVVYHKNGCQADNDDFWKSLVDEGNELSRRYGNTDFVVRLVDTMQMEIERIQKNEDRAKKEK